MITETYGGICPKCNYNRMMMRYGSFGYFHYDACPKCGFAYGTNSEGEYTPEEVWEAILKADEIQLKRLGFPVTRHGLYLWMESLPPPPKGLSSVFGHKKPPWRIA